MRFFSKKTRGFTMIELLIVLTIIAFLSIAGAVAYNLQHQRALDARRKSDLAKLKVIFEDYYNDMGCYPSVVAMSHCGLSDLAPYTPKVPCDPGTGLPYAYTVDVACTRYGVLTTLQDTSDPIIAQLGCSPTCLPGLPYNYGIANSGQDLSAVASDIQAGGGTGGAAPTAPPATATPTPTPVPTPTPTPRIIFSGYACSPSGECNVYADLEASGCPTSYTDPVTCLAACANPANRCAQ